MTAPAAPSASPASSRDVLWLARITVTALVLCVLGVLFYYAATAEFVGRTDAAAYALTARHLVNGDGFLTDTVWLFFNKYDDLVHPEASWPPLQSLFIAASFLAFGQTVFAVKIVNWILFAVLLGVAYRMGTRWFGEWGGLLAAVLLAVNPFLIRLAAPLTLNDMGFILFFLLAVNAFARAAEEHYPAKKLILAGIWTGVAFLSKSQALLLLLGMGAYLLYEWKHNSEDDPSLLTQARRFGIVFAIAFTLNFPVVIRNFATFGTFALPNQSYINVTESMIDEPWNIGQRQRAKQAVYWDAPPTYRDVIADKGARAVFIRAPMTRMKQLARGMLYGEFLQWFLALAAAAGLVLLWNRMRPLTQFLTALGVCSPAFVLFGHYEPRYYFWLIPFAALLTGGVITHAYARYDKPAWRAGVVTVALVLCVFAGNQGAGVLNAALSQQFSHSRLLAVAEWLATNTPPDARLISVDTFAMAWHSGRPTMALPSTDPATLDRVARHYRISHWVAGFIPDTPETRSALERDNPTVLPYLPLYAGDGLPGFTKVYEIPGRYFVYTTPWVE